jgi:hypothetical protein
MAQLFDATKQNIACTQEHLRGRGVETGGISCQGILDNCEDGKRYRRPTLYNLDAILAVGYRVRSPRGVQFRRWASTVLKEYLLKGFAMDDERLKNPDGRPDYFDEMLARIRDIRASEKRFYQKVRDLFALSVRLRQDRPGHPAIFRHGAKHSALRRDPADRGRTHHRPGQSQPIRISACSPGRATRCARQDILVAKNYLTEDEIDTLNRLVVIFLETAELRAKNRRKPA